MFDSLLVTRCWRSQLKSNISKSLPLKSTQQRYRIRTTSGLFPSQSTGNMALDIKPIWTSNVLFLSCRSMKSVGPFSIWDWRTYLGFPGKRINLLKPKDGRTKREGAEHFCETIGSIVCSAACRLSVLIIFIYIYNHFLTQKSLLGVNGALVEQLDFKERVSYLLSGSDAKESNQLQITTSEINYLVMWCLKMVLPWHPSPPVKNLSVILDQDLAHLKKMQKNWFTRLLLLD